MAAKSDGTVEIDVDFNFDNADTSTNRFKKSLTGIESKLKSIAKLAAAAFSIKALVDLGKQAIGFASDLEEVQNVVDTAFGDLSYMVEEFADTAIEKLGISRLAAKEMASTYMAMGKGIGVADKASADMAIGATERAADIMSFYNKTAEEANTMMKAIWTGETESFKAIGVVMTETNLQNFAYTQGINKQLSAMTQAEKVQLRYNYVMQQTGLAAGDFAKTSGSWANQTRMLSEKFKELLGILGGGLIQVLTPAVQFLNLLMSKLIAFANTLSSVFSSLFGTTNKQIEAQTQIAEQTSSAAASTEDLTDATKAAGKEAKKASAGFDTLNVLATSDSLSGSVQNAVGGLPGAGMASGDIINTEKSTSAVDEIADKIKKKIDEIKDYFKSNFAPAFQTVFDSVKPQIDKLKTTFNGIFADVNSWGQPFLNYLTGTLVPSFATQIANMGVIAGGLFDSFNMVLSDVWETVFSPFFGRFITEALPRITEFTTLFSGSFTTVFGEIKTIFDEVWTNGIMPAVTLLGTVFSGLWDGVKSTWDAYAVPVFDALNGAVQAASDLIQTTWESFIKPVWDNFMDTLDWLWQQHLKPLWDNLTSFVAELVLMAMTVYTNVIEPIVKKVVEYLGPAVANAVNTIFNVVSSIVAGIIDVVNGIITTLKGIVQFITGVFSGDWEKAWTGIKNTFGGIWDALVGVVKVPINLIIDLINGLVGGVCAGLNNIIKAINNLSFDVPDWVPGIGGEKFGFNISEIVPPKIPKLATGAVIPPNKEFLAVLGDQKQGTNIEAPLDTMVAAFKAALAESGSAGGTDITVKFSGNEGQLLRYLFNGLEVTKKQRGKSFANA